MQQIFNFVIRNKTFLLFLLLFGIALALTVQSHSYHRSRFINSANGLTGGLYGTLNSITQYFDLKRQNELLIEENKKLREQILNRKSVSNGSVADLSIDEDKYRIVSADVYKNSYNLPNNYLTINKGKRDSIKQDFGVITSKGIVGIIDNTSRKYATVLSILSKKSSVSAQLKSTNHFGSLGWDTKSPQFAQLKDISKFAPVKTGDTIITSGKSTIFPKGLGIGIVKSKVLDDGGDTYTIEVKLFNDMTNLGHVFIIENKDAQQIRTLENNSDG